MKDLEFAVLLRRDVPALRVTRLSHDPRMGMTVTGNGGYAEEKINDRYIKTSTCIYSKFSDE